MTPEVRFVPDDVMVERVANPYWPMQEAVMKVLSEDPDLAGWARVYDYIPEEDPGPYVVWESAWLSEKDALRTPIDRLWFQLSIYSQYRGYKEVSLLGTAVEDTLRHAVLEVEGFNVGGVEVIREQSHLTRSPDTRWRRLAITFHCPYVTQARRA